MAARYLAVVGKKVGTARYHAVTREVAVGISRSPAGRSSDISRPPRFHPPWKHVFKSRCFIYLHPPGEMIGKVTARYPAVTPGVTVRCLAVTRGVTVRYRTITASPPPRYHLNPGHPLEQVITYSGL